MLRLPHPCSRPPRPPPPPRPTRSRSPRPSSPPTRSAPRLLSEPSALQPSIRRMTGTGPTAACGSRPWSCCSSTGSSWAAPTAGSCPCRVYSWRSTCISARRRWESASSPTPPSPFSPMYCLTYVIICKHVAMICETKRQQAICTWQVVVIHIMYRKLGMYASVITATFICGIHPFQKKLNLRV